MELLLDRETHTSPPWKLSLAISVVLHVLAVVLIIYFPQAKKEPKAPFVARLVSPDEVGRVFQREPSARQAPGPRLRTLPSRPVPATPRAARPSRPGRAVPAAPSPSARPGPREVERGLAPEVATGTGGKATTGREASPASPGTGASAGSGSAGSPGRQSITPVPSLKEKLFDREIVEKYAKREERTHDNSITFDTGEFKYEAYMARLKDRIERIWHYPAEAARRGLYGDLYIRFTIKKNGTLGDVELLRTSGHRDLDQAAMQALRDGAPYWPLPDDWGRDALPVTGHFVYSIYGTYIR